MVPLTLMLVSASRQCKKVVFIVGAGHSGTTLLGMMLGTHRDALFASEVLNCQYLDDETRPIHKRTCRVCGPRCKVWSGIKGEVGIYDELAKRSGRSIVIDSSKKPVQWVERQIPKLLDRDISLVYIKRDVRAIVASHLRKKPERTVLSILKGWMYQVEACESLYEKFPDKTASVQYELLAKDPEKTLKQLCEAIDYEYVVEMLYPWDADHHPLRGNAGTQSIMSGDASYMRLVRQQYYQGHPKAIVPDERWKEEISEDIEREMKEIAGDLYAKYIWNK